MAPSFQVACLTLWLSSGFAVHAEQTGTLLGLSWGQSAQEATEGAGATVVSRTFHERYGWPTRSTAFPRTSAARSTGSSTSMTRTSFNECGSTSAIQVGQSWEENYSLDEAITKYRELKADVARRHRELECEEPKLERVEEEGRVILDRSYRPNRTVWACEYERGPTHLKVSMRRLGDTPGERFDVIFDALLRAAVTAYQNGHRLRRPEERSGGLVRFRLALPLVGG